MIIPEIRQILPKSVSKMVSSCSYRSLKFPQGCKFSFLIKFRHSTLNAFYFNQSEKTVRLYQKYKDEDYVGYYITQRG